MSKSYENKNKNDEMKQFFSEKMKHRINKQKIDNLSNKTDKSSKIALQKLEKRMKYEFIINDTNFIKKDNTGQEIQNIRREKTSYIKDVENDIYDKIQKNSEEDICKKYDILFEFQKYEQGDEMTLLKEIQEKEDLLKSLLQAKQALYNYHISSVKNIESEINTIHLSLNVICESLKEEKNKTEKYELLKSYNDNYSRLLEMKSKLIELSNIPEIQYSVINK